METFLDFVNANYIWLIVIAIIILLAIIGYIAEKQGFGRKEKDLKSNLKEESIEKPIIKNVEDSKVDFNATKTLENEETDKIEESNLEEASEVEKPLLEETDKVEELSSEEDDETNKAESNLEENSETEEADELSNIEPIDDNEDKENSKIEEDSSNDSELSEEINNEEDLYAPFGDKEFKKEENNLNIDKDFNKVLENVEDSTDLSDVDLPNIEPTTKEELDDEDIWKF